MVVDEVTNDKTEQISGWFHFHAFILTKLCWLAFLSCKVYFTAMLSVYLTLSLQLKTFAYLPKLILLYDFTSNLIRLPVFKREIK